MEIKKLRNLLIRYLLLIDEYENISKSEMNDFDISINNINDELKKLI